MKKQIMNMTKIVSNPVLCIGCPRCSFSKYSDSANVKVVTIRCERYGFISRFHDNKLSHINYLPDDCDYFLEQTLSPFLCEVDIVSVSSRVNDILLEEAMEKVQENLTKQNFSI